MPIKNCFPIVQRCKFQRGSFNEKYFLEMMHPDALKIAQPFLDEECQIILNLIKSHCCTQFLGLGSANGLYSNVISRCCNYIGVDPFHHLNKRKTKIIRKKFQDIDIERGNDKFIISFLFNLISYIDQLDIVHFLNRNSKSGDIITISTWNTDLVSLSLRKKYFHRIIPNTDRELSYKQGIVNLEEISISNIKHYKFHEILKFKYSTILIIYL